MNAYTKGPWTVFTDNREDRNGLVYVAGYNIDAAGQTIVGDEGICGYDNGEADARLIAAAPDSHEANVKTVEAFDAAFGIQGDWDDERIFDELPGAAIACAYFAARAAIAKVRGQA